MTETPFEPTDAVLSDPTGCAVEAYGVVKVAVEEIAALRKAPGPLGGRTIPASLLKHADHQTVLALAAVLRAVDEFGWHDRSFADWGLIAAPRFLGRINVAASMDRFKRRGVPSMSPLIIPTLSLHAVAGSLSLAMKSHGFNYGVGGGHGHLAEALLTGLAARDDNGVPGVWVVATQFSPEPVPDTAGHSLIPSFGYGVALALTAAAPGGPAGTSGSSRRPPPSGRATTATSRGSSPLRDRSHSLSSCPPRWRTSRPRRWYCPLPGGGAVELEDDAARAAGHAEARAG